MNRDRYRTIFSKRLGTLVAVAETTKAQGKGSGSARGSGARASRQARGSQSLGGMSAISLGVALALWGQAAFASPPLPTGGTITSGGGTISQSGNTLTVNQSSQSLAANWQSFDIDAGHSVVFNQPNSSSVALNRVIGPDASAIYGSLSANGKVFLVNPNGVLFAPGAQVSVGGLVASTLKVSDEDFAAGRYRFTEGSGAGSVVNQGEINAESVALIAPKIVNSGAIRTPGGNTTFAAGDRVTVSMLNGLLTAEVDAAVVGAEIHNHGQIVATGGEVKMLAGRGDAVVDSLINIDGVVQAGSIRSENGKVYLDGGAGGTVYVSGTLDVSAAEAGAHGGDVTVLGKHVGLMQGARIDASGDSGGGTVLIGGNWQGIGPEHNADATYMDQNAAIRADATGNGDGGTVVLWSDKYTGFYGDISARGGASGGNGGQVETSSHENLQAMGSVDATSPAGKGGAWLLDPSDITISNSATSGGGFDSGTPTNVFTPGVGASSSTVNAADIVASLNNGTSVTIQTNSTGTGGGDIDVAAAIAKSSGGDATLRLNADRNIRVAADITSSSNRLNIILNSHYSNDAASGLVLVQNATLNSNGGNITIGGGSTPETMPARGGNTGYGGADPRIGVYIVGSTVNAAGGNIIINGEGLSSPSGGFPNGIATGGATIMTSGTGTIRMTGTAGLGGTPALYFDGIQLSNTDIHTEHGALDLIGTGSDWSDSAGIRFREDGGGSTRIYSSTGAITLTATSLNATRPAIYAVPTPPVYLGWDGGTNVSSGDLTIRGSATVANGISLSNTTRINGAGGNLTIGSTGGGLSSLTLPSGVIAAGSLWNNVTIGDASTGSIAINGNTFDAAGAINITGSSYSFANANTLRSSTLAFGNTNGIANTGTLTLEQSGNSTIANAISGTSGNLVKAGAGTTVLTGNNTYTGTTTISGGTLQIGDGGTTGTLGTGAVTDNGTLVFNRSDAITVANAIGGLGSVRKEGIGTVTLTASNTYSGATTINAGTLALQNGNASPSYSIASGAVLDLNVASGTRSMPTATFSGAGTLRKTGAGTVIWGSPAATFALSSGALIDVQEGTFIGGSNANEVWTNNFADLNVASGAVFDGVEANVRVDALTGAGTIRTGLACCGYTGLAFGVDNGSGDFSGVLANSSGVGSYVKVGSGTQILSGANTYTGTTTISGGTLQIGNGGPAGTLGTGAVANDANLVFDRSDTVTVANAIGGTGTVTQAGSGTTILSANNSYSGTTSVNAGTLQVGNGGTAGSLGTGAATVNAAGTLRWYRSTAMLDIPNSISGTGTLSFLGTGSFGQSDYILSGNNSGFTGPVIIDRARLRYDNADDLGAAAPITVLSGGQLWAAADIDNAMTLNGTGWSDASGALFLLSGANASGSITLQSDTRIGVSTTGTVSGVISGAGNLAKSPNTGTLILTGNNTYTGTTTVMLGTLAITSAAGLGSASGGTTIEGGAVLDLRNVALEAETITLNGNTSTAMLTATTGPSSFSGNLVLNGAHASGNVVNAAEGVELTLSGVISGDGTLTKASGGTGGLGTVVLAGNNTYTGMTVVSTGTLAVTSASALGSTSAGTRISQGGTLDLRNVALGAETITINSGFGTAVLTATTGPSSLAGNVILTGFINNQVAAAAGVELTLSGEISGSRLTKGDAGTVILTGNNTYTGTTTVSAGTLQVGNDGTTGTLGAGAVTNNANLVFNRSNSTSLGTLAAGGISGTGNVTALIGGDFNVDREIALSGANSTILLEAGKGVPAGTAAGGDVTLSSNVSTSATGTLTIFSGNATTGAYEAMVSGADGPTRYKTYGASAGDTAGAITGTRNYYYRQQPSTLTVSGLTATKVYDGLLDASTVLDGTAAIVNGAIDGDSVAFSSLTLLGAEFDSAHAGPRTLNASFAGATPSYSGGGATWSISGYSANVTGTGTGTITPRPVSTSINAVGRDYNGFTNTTSTLAAPTGFIGNDSATGVAGLLLAFDDPNAGTRNVTASGTGVVTGFSGASSGNGSGIGAGNEVAGLASDYSVTLPSAASAVITPAALTVTANDDAKIITQGDAAGYNGVSFSGFVNGESVADLTGTLAITRSNAGTEAAGNYVGVLVPTGYNSGNYAISYVNGDYRILPAQQLLVHIQNLSTAYGTVASYAVTGAEYLDGSGTSLHTLTQTAHSGNTYTFSDGLGGSVTFTIAPAGAVLSSAGHLAVGNYGLSGIDTSIGGNNFAGLNYVGNHAVTPIGLTPFGVSRVYDGTTSMTGAALGLTGLLGGDQVLAQATGAFRSRNAGNDVGYDINHIALGGADAGNYYLTTGALSGTNGVITPRAITLTGISGIDRIYDGTTVASLMMAGYGFDGLVTGDAVTLDASSYSAWFDSKHVGMDKAVTVTGLALSGVDVGNYVLTQPAGLFADVTPRPLTITAIADIKTFDGTTNAVGTPTVAGDLASGDSFTLLGQEYATAHVGTGLALMPIVGIDDGNGGANYALTLVNNTAGEIRPGIDLSQVGGSQISARLNGDSASAENGTSEDAAGGVCVRGRNGNGCSAGEASGAMIQVRSTGIRLPSGLADAESSQHERPL